MSVRDTLEQIEALVVDASHLPLTDKIIVGEQDLVHLVEELRQELPLELERADQIMKDKESIIRTAQEEAAAIVKQAKQFAEKLIDENDIVVKARERSQTVLTQAKQQEQEIVERTRMNARQLQEDADRYANQVFDQLITHVTNTFQGVQQAQAGLEQARQILQQAKIQMNAAAAQQAYAQAQPQPQPQPPSPPPYNGAVPNQTPYGMPTDG